MSLERSINSKFWLMRQYMVDNNINDLGHSLLSIEQLIWIIVIVSFIIWITRLYLKSNSKKKSQIKKIFASLIIFLEVIKVIVTGFLYPQYINEYLPLHLCSFAGFCIIFEALFEQKRIINQWWIYIFLFAGILGVVSPSNSYPWFNYYLLHAYIYHTLITAYAIIKIASREAVPTYKGIWQSALLIALLLEPINIINKTFHTNYFLITNPGDFALCNLIWKYSSPYGEQFYLIAMCFLGFILFHIIYFVYKIFKKRSHK